MKYMFVSHTRFYRHCNDTKRQGVPPAVIDGKKARCAVSRHCGHNTQKMLLKMPILVQIIDGNALKCYYESQKGLTFMKKTLSTMLKQQCQIMRENVQP